MKLFKCNCEVADLTRIRRTAWMRLIPSMRLFFCRGCRCTVTVLARRNFDHPFFVQPSRGYQLACAPLARLGQPLFVASKRVVRAKIVLMKTTELRWVDTELMGDFG